MNSAFVKRLGYGFLFAAFAFYSVRLAPQNTPDVSLQDLALRHGPGRNPAIFAAFNLLGIIPLAYWVLLFEDGLGQRVWAWPFAFGMMAFGSFALLPYLILRRSYSGPPIRKPNAFVRWLSSKPFAVFVALALLGLLCYGVGWGDFADYARWFRRSALINTMTVDLLLLILLFPALLRDDMARHGVSEEDGLGRFALAVPLFGPAFYLILRPQEKQIS